VRTPAVAIALSVALAACSNDRALEWGVHFATPSLAARATHVEAAIRAGSCTSAIVFVADFPVADGSAAAMPSRLAPGRYALTARARDAACTWFAEGCLEIDLPTAGPAIVEVVAAAESPACPPGACVAGACASPDAGSDGGARDAPMGRTDAPSCSVPLGGACGPTAECCEGDCCAGECADRSTDPAHCGACGNVCGPSSSCAAGACVCDPGSADCDASPLNGCETSLDSLAHCGACGNVCSRPNATEVCDGATCRIASCDPLFADCDMADANGCERSLATLIDCGACGSTCVRPAATTMCAGGTCLLASCNAGFGNCDGNDANGCENTLDSLAHCGGCGMPCIRANATATCAGDVCRLVTCNAGFANCDSVDANGCEVNLMTSFAHCGACGMGCSVTRSDNCAGGACRCGGQPRCVIGESCSGGMCL
jgi:hypothetical protein